jgi:GGDEF domain-containing protein
VARSSGDEFIAVLHIFEADILPLAQRLMDSVSEPMTLSTGSVITQRSRSGSPTVHPTTTQNCTLRGADAALHHAKHLGRAQAYRFDDHLSART